MLIWPDTTRGDVDMAMQGYWSSAPRIGKTAGGDAMDKRTGIKKSGKFEGKSNALGHGGRAEQLEAKGVPGGVIGNLARAAQAAPGQKNFHGGKRGK